MAVTTKKAAGQRFAALSKELAIKKFGPNFSQNQLAQAMRETLKTHPAVHGLYQSEVLSGRRA